MAVPSNVVRMAYVEAFKHNKQVIPRSGHIAASTPFEATVGFETTRGTTVAVKWKSNGSYTYLG